MPRDINYSTYTDSWRVTTALLPQPEKKKKRNAHVHWHTKMDQNTPALYALLANEWR